MTVFHHVLSEDSVCFACFFANLVKSPVRLPSLNLVVAQAILLM